MQRHIMQNCKSEKVSIIAVFYMTEKAIKKSTFFSTFPKKYNVLESLMLGYSD
jgi:hypothetical protein